MWISRAEPTPSSDCYPSATASRGEGCPPTTPPPYPANLGADRRCPQTTSQPTTSRPVTGGACAFDQRPPTSDATPPASDQKIRGGIRRLGPETLVGEAGGAPSRGWWCAPSRACFVLQIPKLRLTARRASSARASSASLRSWAMRSRRAWISACVVARSRAWPAWMMAHTS